MAEARPNIVFVVTDQQRYDTIRALGYPHVDTPVLDRLAAEGTWFSRCYVAGASCVPARASLFSGYFPHTTGVANNAAGWTRTWVSHLAGAGYRCVSIGKMHTQPMDAPAGFHERLVVENKDRSQAIRGSDFVDEWDKALAAVSITGSIAVYSRMPCIFQPFPCERCTHKKGTRSEERGPRQQNEKPRTSYLDPRA